MTRVIALDVGTSSVRARAYDESGAWEEGAEAQVPYAGELDADDIVTAARAVFDEVSREARGPVDAVAGCAFWHSLLALDGRGRPLAPLLTWGETRAAEQARRLGERLDGADVHARTGCPLHPSFWPAQLAWLAETEPEIFSEAKSFVPFPHYLYERLAGEGRTSLSIASGTGLLDVNESRWDEELLEALAVEPERLPAVSDDPVDSALPWFPALGDGACSNVGTGALGRTRAALTIGTSAAFRVVFEADRTAPRPGLFLYRLDERRFVEGGSLSDGGNLYLWLERTLRLDRAGPEAPPGEHGLTFLPLLGGERAPGWNATARGAIAGLTFATTPAQILQAALEGVAFRVAAIAELLPEATEVVATGAALLANERWVQIVADVLERPVEVSAVPEGSARGAAVVALERLGVEADPAPVAVTVEPREDLAAAYRSAREKQRALYETLT